MICGICGRRLKSAKSKELGYGPVCYKRKFGASLQTSRGDAVASAGEETNYNLPGQMSVEDYLQMFSEQ